MSVKHFTLGTLAVIAALGVVLFLGGLCSAALEVRRERRAGLEPTRPAWDERAKREAVPLRDRLWLLWHRARYRGTEWCWCARGTLDVFPARDGSQAAGLGCSAWEAGDPQAILRHDAAGGYARTPVSA